MDDFTRTDETLITELGTRAEHALWWENVVGWCGHGTKTLLELTSM